MMERKPFETNGNNGVGVSDPTFPTSSNVEPGLDFTRLKYVEGEESTPGDGRREKSTGVKRRRTLRGVLLLAGLGLVAVAFFWIVGGGRKKIDLPVRDRGAQSEITPQKIDDAMEQAIAEVRGGAARSAPPAPGATTSVDSATARDTTPAPIPLGGTVDSVERPPTPIPPGDSSSGASTRPPETVSGRNDERSIRCAPVRKPVAALSPPPATPDLAPARAGALPSLQPVTEKTVTLPPFGAMLPVRTLGAIYTLRPSLSRFELTRDVRGAGWTMKRGTILIGQQQGSELDRAYVSLTGFIDPDSGKLAKLAGYALGSDGAPGLRGKRRQVSGRWTRVLGRAANAAVSLGQAALARGNSTTVVLPSAVAPELSLSQSVASRREFVEVPAGATAFVLVTDLPKEVRGVDPQPEADSSGDFSLGDEELANLLTGGSPEEIRAALPRMTPELRRIAEAVLRESK
jgi:hypothetical protein